MKKTNRLLMTAIVLAMIFSIVGMFSISASAEGETEHSDVTLVPQVNATFDTKGSLAYYTCSHCDKIFADEACTTEITGDLTTPKLSLDDYEITKVDKGGSDKAPVITTTFTLKSETVDYSVNVVTDNCLRVNRGEGDILVSEYNYKSLNTDIVEVSYSKETGYTYSVKEKCTETGITGIGIRAYGTTLTITGNVELNLTSRWGHNVGLIVGTADKKANVSVTATGSGDDYKHGIALWDGADLTLNSGSILSITNSAGDSINCNETGSVITISGELKTSGNICNPGDDIFKSTANATIGKAFYKTGGSITVDGEVTAGTYVNFENAAGTITVNGTFTVGSYMKFYECKSLVINEGATVTVGTYLTAPGAASYTEGSEYGFNPRVLVLGKLTVKAGAFTVNSLQVGSESQKATLNLTHNNNNIVPSNQKAELRYAFVNVDMNVTNNHATKSRCAIDIRTNGGAYVDIRKGTSIKLNGNYGSTIGEWTTGTYHISIQQGLSVDLGSNNKHFIRVGNNTVNVYCWKPVAINVGGEYKEVKVVKKYTYSADAYHENNVFYTPVWNAVFTNTGNTIDCGHLGTFNEATYDDVSRTVHTIYYNVTGDHTHTEIIDVAVAPTCTETGLTEGKHCDECYTVLVAQNTVAALGHNIVVDAAVAATCTTTGLTEGQHCTRCSDKTIAQNVVPANGHTEVIDAAVAATCTTTGLTEGKHCSVCNEVLVAQTTVETVPHNLDEDGVCSSCGLVPLPKAEVTELKATLEGLKTPLTFALNFKIKDYENFSESYLEALMNKYGNYYVDYVLTIEGLPESGVTFNANGSADGYLAGQYDEWSENWVYVPFKDVTLENGKSLYIMATAADLMNKNGLRYTLAEIAAIVKDFDCGVYFTDEFMDANPGMVVTLELKIFTEDDEGNIVDDTTLAINKFTVDNIPVKLPEAEVTDIKNNLTDEDPDLTFALNFAIKDYDRLNPNSASYDEAYTKALLEEYGYYYVDYVLTITGLTDGGVTFNANGNADGYLAGQYDAWSENWVSVPFNDVTLKNGESLYIMEYAAKLMGKTGLRYTLEEVAAIVVNFDCGTYFTREFLEANPNMKVTLELVVFTEDSNGKIVDSASLANNVFTTSDIVAVVEGEGHQTHYCKTLQAAFDVAEDGETITLIKNIDLTETVTASGAKTVALNLNGKTVKSTADVLLAVSDGITVKVDGNGTVSCTNAIFSEADATVELYSGTYSEDVDDYCADGYDSLIKLDTHYVVGSKPTATVNNLGPLTVPSNEYGTYDGGFNKTDTGIDMPLSFVMQFLADQTAADMLTSPFADWYADFVIVFNGIENDSFVANGCYLAGYYGNWGWIKVPVDGMEIKEGARYPVMLGIGAGQKYDYICESVKDFRCALYIPQEILDANPNLSVTLSLNLIDNSEGQDAATDALVDKNNKNTYNVIASYDFKSEYFKGPAAQIGDKSYYELQDAFDALEVGDVLVVLRDNELAAQVVIDKNVTIDFGGFKVTTVDGADLAIAAKSPAFTLIALGEDKYAIIGAPNIGNNGNWFVGYDDTDVKATGNDGVGIKDCVTEDLKDNDGKVIGHKVTITFTDDREPVVLEVLHGKDAVVPKFEIKEGHLWVSYDNEATWNDLGLVKGADGSDGTNGSNGAPGKDGLGVKSVVINENGHLIITYTDDTTKDLGNVMGADGQNGSNGTNGANGADGKTPIFKLEENGDIFVRFDETEEWTLLGNIMGQTGDKGETGATGATGATGENSNVAIIIVGVVAIVAIIMSAVALVFVNKYSYKPWWMI